MPEGDTVHRAARRLHDALAGEVVVRSDLRVPSLATADLSGRRVLEAVARGKHILVRFEGGLTLHSHFMMDGEWLIRRPGGRLPPPAHHIRAVISTGRITAVGMRLAQLKLLRTEREVEVVGHLGPDLLGDDWDAGRVLAALRARPETPIGAALLDQRVLAGVGNVYKTEICFLRGIDPRTPVGRVTGLEELVDLTKRLMEANRATGRQITTGDTRKGRERWVYGKAGMPCPRCRTPIVRFHQPGPKWLTAAERVSYICPSCQPPLV